MGNERVSDKIFRNASLADWNASLSMLHYFANMKRAVILCLCLLTCLVLSVECDDEGTLSTNDEGNNDDMDGDFGSLDGKSIETDFDVTENDNSAGGELLTQSDSEIQKTVKCLGNWTQSYFAFYPFNKQKIVFSM